mgnify:CR=1 FL=1|jgi:hypothetical protein|nr:MAG TPA: hypothetical protein [Caudoviricetes sp.]
MSRPTKFEDLNNYDQQGPMVATFNHVIFLSLPRKTLIRVLKTVESLDKNVADGILDRRGSIETGEDLVYRFRPTEKDREKKLRNAQSEWDRTKKRYEDALVDPTSTPDWMHWLINQWAEAEGKPAIEWPDTEND